MPFYNECNNLQDAKITVKILEAIPWTMTFIPGWINGVKVFAEVGCIEELKAAKDDLEALNFSPLLCPR